MFNDMLLSLDTTPLPRNPHISAKMASHTLLNKGSKPPRETLHTPNLKLPFPWKLLMMLEDTEKGSNEHIVSWLPDGTGFIIHKEKEFCETVLTSYFKQTKLKSFTRQLYLYGFLKISAGRNIGGFTHPKFIRGDRDSCLSIRRNQFAGDRRQTKKARRDSWLEDSPGKKSNNTAEGDNQSKKMKKMALTLFDEAFTWLREGDGNTTTPAQAYEPVLPSSMHPPLNQHIQPQEDQSHSSEDTLFKASMMVAPPFPDYHHNEPASSNMPNGIPFLPQQPQELNTAIAPREQISEQERAVVPLSAGVVKEEDDWFHVLLERTFMNKGSGVDHPPEDVKPASLDFAPRTVESMMGRDASSSGQSLPPAPAPSSSSSSSNKNNQTDTWTI